MGKKIHTVILKDLELVEIDGEFREVYKNEKKYPLYITNHALRRGRDLGLIESGMLADILSLEKSIKGKNKEDAARSLIQDLDEQKMLNVIYLAFLGANPKTEYSLDDFLERYHGDSVETITLYVEIIESSVDDKENKFASSLRKSTKKQSSKEKK